MNQTEDLTTSFPYIVIDEEVEDDVESRVTENSNILEEVLDMVLVVSPNDSFIKSIDVDVATEASDESNALTEDEFSHIKTDLQTDISSLEVEGSGIEFADDEDDDDEELVLSVEKLEKTIVAESSGETDRQELSHENVNNIESSGEVDKQPIIIMEEQEEEPSELIDENLMTTLPTITNKVLDENTLANGKSVVPRNLEDNNKGNQIVFSDKEEMRSALLEEVSEATPTSLPETIEIPTTQLGENVNPPIELFSEELEKDLSKNINDEVTTSPPTITEGSIIENKETLPTTEIALETIDITTVKSSEVSPSNLNDSEENIISKEFTISSTNEIDEETTIYSKLEAAADDLEVVTDFPTTEAKVTETVVALRTKRYQSSNNF